MNPRVAIVTGGSSGIGLNAAKKLVNQGIYTIIASRNLALLNKVVNDIKTETNRDNIEAMRLDLSDFQSVRDFAADFKAKHLPLHTLVNNAGLIVTKKTLTKDGLESTFQSNHLGHFLLTNLLLDTLKASAPSRVVITASMMHDPKTGGFGKGFKVDWDDLMFDHKPYNDQVAYRISKLANVLFCYELNRRLQGTGVIVNAFCPGFIPQTNLARDHHWILMGLVRAVMKLFPSATRTIDHGGDCIVDLATKDTSEITEGGHFFSDRVPRTSSAFSLEVDNQRRMWEISEKLVGLV